MKKMKKFINAIACSSVMMLAGITACSDNNGEIKDAYTEEQLEWIAQNTEYFQHKKDSVDINGKLVYQQLVVFRDTLLYRLKSEIGAVDSFPEPNSTVEANVKGWLPVNNFVFTGKKDAGVDLKIRMDDENVIVGLREVIRKTRKGETIEAVIPYQLGYGAQDNPYYTIPPCSVLMFDIRVDNFNK